MTHNIQWQHNSKFSITNIGDQKGYLKPVIWTQDGVYVHSKFNKHALNHYSMNEYPLHS